MTERLVGRERELRVIREFVDRVRVAPGALLLDGQAGIGKSVLWGAAVELARERDIRVLSCRPVEVEAQLSFTAVADLLDPVLEDVLASLRGPRRKALAVALVLEEPDQGPLDQRTIGAALVDALRELARQQPLVLAIDDAQWLDTSSARALQFALRRVGSSPVGVLQTVRGEHATPVLAGTGDVTVLTVGPLSEGEIHGMLKDALGLNLTRPDLVRLCQATGSNPLFALEVGREIADAGGRTSGDPLPVPRTVRDLVADRVRRLPAATQDVLLTAATAGRPTVEVVTSVHGLQARKRLEQAGRAGVVTIEGDRIRFAHPLLAAACYQDAPTRKRRTSHERLAAVTSDPEERARHLALASDAPDESVAESVSSAAVYAADRGRTAAAGELLELAATLTPPTAATLRRERLLQAARFHRVAGERDRAGVLLDELLAGATADERADILLELARIRRGPVSSSIDLCEQALLATADSARVAEIFAYSSFLRILAGDVYGGLRAARSGLERAEALGNPELLARTIGRVASAEQFALEMTPGLLERGVALERTLPRRLGYPESPTIALARRLSLLGQLERARELMLAEERRAEAVGDEGTRGQLLFYLTMVEWNAGRSDAGLDHSGAALELAEQLGDMQFRGMALYGRAAILARLGREEETRGLLTEASSIAAASNDATFPIWAASLLGALELSLGNVTAAAEHLVPLPEELAAQGWNEPADPWPEAIEVLVKVEEVPHARRLLTTFVSLARKLGAPHALAFACRCEALVEAAEGRVDDALETYDRALEHHARSEHRFELGRTLLLAGTTRRRARQRRTARETLEQARAVFDELGAALWVARADEEIARIAGRAPAGKTLTRTEARVVELVRTGRSNKEIASTLFVTVHTVEAHLTRIYRKLGIHSRSELLAGPSTGVGEPKV